MTLNAVIALILRFFSRNSTDFQADYITVVEDKLIIILSPSSSLLLLAKTITLPAARSLCDSRASCNNNNNNNNNRHHHHHDMTPVNVCFTELTSVLISTCMFAVSANVMHSWQLHIFNAIMHIVFFVFDFDYRVFLNFCIVFSMLPFLVNKDVYIFTLFSCNFLYITGSM